MKVDVQAHPVHSVFPRELLANAGWALACLLALGSASPAAEAETAAAATAAVADSRLQEQINQRLGLERSELLDLPQLAPGQKTLSVDVRIAGQSYQLLLDRYSVRSDDFQVLRQVPGGFEPVNPPPVSTFLGKMANLPGSVVVASVQADGFYASLKRPDDDYLYWIQPAPADLSGSRGGLHVAYRGDEVRPSTGSCGVEGTAADELLQRGLETAAASGSVAEIIVDTDSRYYQRWKGSVTSRAEWIIAVVNVQYSRDVQIFHKISQIVLRPDPSLDPFTTDDPSLLLGQLRDHWETPPRNDRKTFPRDVLQLLTGRDLAGTTVGIAFVGEACGQGYSLVQSDYSSSLPFVTDDTAHELGHTWGAGHCACGGPHVWTMNPIITGANLHHLDSIDQIERFRGSARCLDPAPANDECEGAITIPKGPAIPFDTRAASNSAVGSACGTSFWSDLWFLYTAKCEGPTTVSTCGSDFDTQVTVYDERSSFCDRYKPLGCNDDRCALQSAVDFYALRSQTYLIRVGGYGGALGTGQLLIKGPPDITNDTCARATVIGDGPFAFDSRCATGEGPDEEDDACGPLRPFSGLIYNDVWLRYRASCTGFATASLCGAADFDTLLAVYGATCPTASGQLLTCNDNACSVQSSARFAVVKGAEYLIRIGGARGNSGMGTVSMACSP